MVLTLLTEASVRNSVMTVEYLSSYASVMGVAVVDTVILSRSAYR